MWINSLLRIAILLRFFLTAKFAKLKDAKSAKKKIDQEPGDKKKEKRK